MCVDSWNVSGSAGHAEILSPESDPDALGFDFETKRRLFSLTTHINNLCAIAYGVEYTRGKCGRGPLRTGDPLLPKTRGKQRNAPTESA